MRHPVLKFTDQCRFRPVFAEWLNHRIYGNEMRCYPSTQDIKVSQKWDSMIRSALLLNTVDKIDTGYLVLSVAASKCEIDASSKSRFNRPHVEAVLDLILRNNEVQAYRNEDTRILTPYRAQKFLYHQRLFELAD